MPKFTHHLFVCGNRRSPDHPRGCCNPDGTDALRSALKSAIEQHGLKPLVRANAAGCLDQCERGPIVVIYPQAIWYGGVTLADVPRIVERTLIAGEILDDLVIPDPLLNCRDQDPAATRRQTPDGLEPEGGAG